MTDAVQEKGEKRSRKIKGKSWTVRKRPENRDDLKGVLQIQDKEPTLEEGKEDQKDQKIKAREEKKFNQEVLIQNMLDLSN